MGGSLAGKLFVVTGGSGDLGGEIAMAAAEEGAKVVATYNTGRARAARLKAEAGSRKLDVEVLHLDVSDEAAVKAFFERTAARLGPIDALINAAGHSNRETWFASLDELDSEKWLGVIKVDLLGSFFCCREAARQMRNGSSIVNFSSAAGVTGHIEGLPYSAAKAAVIGLTKSLSSILGPRIRVNAVAPGNIDAGSIAWYDQKGRDQMAAEASLKRLGTRREVAEMALFLASGKSSFITGQVVLVDGGI
jgi:3-oxoacyl-[acyl-carrier protein] reductase